MRSSNPKIYQINTWAWLETLSRRYGERITLANIPPDAWESILLHFDAVWLMGVWERSPRGVEIATHHPDLQKEYQAALSDFTPVDIAGSPYCIHQYNVETRLGGETGLAVARQQLAERNLQLILDYVPNHVAPDHPWVYAHPEYFLQGTAKELTAKPHHFFAANGRIIANGRDPHFDPWTDTAQLNAYSPALRQESINILLKIASQCDGVRCDMAMLMTNHTFARTWGKRAGQPPAQDFWREVIPAVKAQYPEFTWIAEVYWDLEYEMLQQGFDFCYDKKLYDHLRDDKAEKARLHLSTSIEYQKHLVRFIENHDEQRAIKVYGAARSQAAALITLTLPGVRLVHEGQIDGHQIKIPVQLGRRPVEPNNSALRQFYARLLAVKLTGEWQMCMISPGGQKNTHQHLIAFEWVDVSERHIIVVNYSAAPAEGYLHPQPFDLEQRWRFEDMLSGEMIEYEGEYLHHHAPHIQLKAWEGRLFRVTVG